MESDPEQHPPTIHPWKTQEVPFQGGWAEDWTIHKSLVPSVHFNSQAGPEKWFREGWLLTWGQTADLGFESRPEI